jgi:hypothetical protein
MSCSLELYFINLLRYEYYFKVIEANRYHKTPFSFLLCFFLHTRALVRHVQGCFCSFTQVTHGWFVDLRNGCRNLLAHIFVVICVREI